MFPFPVWLGSKEIVAVKEILVSLRKKLNYSLNRRRILCYNCPKEADYFRMTDSETKRMRKLLCFLIFMVFISPVNAQTIYKWTDEKGVVNYTDEYSKVPPKYRDQVEAEKWKDTQKPRVPSLAPPQAPPQESGEATMDIYGRDEAWWRDRVRLWKEKLKEATENYEKAQANFTKKSEELSQTNFAGRSRSQTKWDVMDLNRLNEEKKKYEAQVAEANEMLNQISKEAEEAKANPDWLK